MAILQDIYITGGNDSEFPRIREILDKLNPGKITPKEAIEQAQKILASKMDYR